MKKRIDVSKFNFKDWRDVSRLRDELKDNLYYNQTWIWCENCGKRHRLSSGIPWGHSVKPMPIKCEVDGDHCWKRVNQKKKFGMEIHEEIKNDVSISLTEGNVIECIICKKKGLRELTYIMGNAVDMTTTQLKELDEYIISIKNIGFKKLNKMTCKRYEIIGGRTMLKIPELDEKIREIQNIQDYVII